MMVLHDDVIKWTHFPRNWPFVREIHRSLVISPHKGQWRGAFVFSLICAWINGWVNNGDAGDLRRHRAHCDVIVMLSPTVWKILTHLLTRWDRTSSNVMGWVTRPPLPTKTYTTLVPKLEKYPLFADSGREKHPFFNRNRWLWGPIKHPFWKQNAILFSLHKMNFFLHL